ncbi:MAG: NADH-quinone oxidoreductase subunit J [Candidatus Omnitrophota bacterium]
MTLDTFLLAVTLAFSLWTVMAKSLLRSAIGLAATSVAVTVLMFRLNSPLAAVFELSVCSGLITVIFISTISLTKPLAAKEAIEAGKAHVRRFRYLFVLVAAAGIGMLFLNLVPDFKPHCSAAASDARAILWNFRQMDLFGQIIIIIVGALGVVVLFAERGKDER